MSDNAWNLTGAMRSLILRLQLVSLAHTTLLLAHWDPGTQPSSGLGHSHCSQKLCACYSLFGMLLPLPLLHFNLVQT